jgi:hypothetical protein
MRLHTAPLPTFDDYDVQDLSERLATDHSGCPLTPL